MWGVCTINKGKIKYYDMVIFMALQMLFGYNCVTEIYGELNNSEKQWEHHIWYLLQQFNLVVVEVKVGMDSTQTDEHDCIPIKLNGCWSWNFI